MALHTRTNGSSALRGSQTPAAPVLRLVPTSPPDIWRSEEADIEAIAFMDETAQAMSDLIDAEIARDVPSLRVIHIAGRVAYRAGLARSEVLRLRGGDVA